MRVYRNRRPTVTKEDMRETPRDGAAAFRMGLRRCPPARARDGERTAWLRDWDAAAFAKAMGGARV